jgi:hypothetical protein
MLKNLKKLWERGKNQRGQNFILLALVMISILMVIGVGMDGGRLYFYWTGLTRALDAGCVAAIRKAKDLGDGDIKGIVTQVATYNMQQQGADVSKLTVNTTVARRPEYNRLIKLQVTGTLQEIASAILHMIPGQEESTIAAQSRCPTCYDLPENFTVSPGLYQGGLDCQLACNDGVYQIPGTTTCCPYQHGYIFGDPTSTCACAYSAALDVLTDHCDPNANGPQAINADDPGISGPVWIDRPDQDNLGNACVAECVDRGFEAGYLACNEGCRLDTGTICCKCHCVGEVQC